MKNFIVDFFFILASIPRLLLEVFIRKNFGERYLPFSLVVVVFLVLAAWPIIAVKTIQGLASLSPMPEATPVKSSMWNYLTWYIYLLAFLYLGFRHNRDVKRRKKAFDRERYSRYDGDLKGVFFRLSIRLRGKVSLRFMQIVLEPAPFFIVGIILIIIGQRLGNLLLVCSVFYSLSYWAAFIRADNYVLDMIDETIISEEMEPVFLSDDETAESRGFRFIGKRPDSYDLRRKLLDERRDNEPPTPVL